MKRDHEDEQGGYAGLRHWGLYRMVKHGDYTTWTSPPGGLISVRPGMSGAKNLNLKRKCETCRAVCKDTHVLSTLCRMSTIAYDEALREPSDATHVCMGVGETFLCEKHWEASREYSLCYVPGGKDTHWTYMTIEELKDINDNGPKNIDLGRLPKQMRWLFKK